VSSKQGATFIVFVCCFAFVAILITVVKVKNTSIAIPNYIEQIETEKNSPKAYLINYRIEVYPNGFAAQVGTHTNFELMYSQGHADSNTIEWKRISEYTSFGYDHSFDTWNLYGEVNEHNILSTRQEVKERIKRFDKWRKYMHIKEQNKVEPTYEEVEL